MAARGCSPPAALTARQRVRGEALGDFSSSRAETPARRACSSSCGDRHGLQAVFGFLLVYFGLLLSR